MTDYTAQVKTLAPVCGGDEAMRTATMGMVNDNIPEAEAESLIISILWELFECDSFMGYLNDYRELKLRAGGCQTGDNEPECETLTDPFDIHNKVRKRL